VERDSPEELEKLLSDVSSQEIQLTNSALRAAGNNSTVLHTALEKERWNVAKLLIQSRDESFLTEYYNITIRNMPSKKYCIHILTEKGNYELTKLFLERFTNETRLKTVLKQTVTVEIEGQRPRPLAAIHIAALKGHTNLIDLFHSLGVDVNTTNNKNDTPVLWAARGNHVQTVRRLIELGAKLELENDKGSTPLYWAVRYGFPELVRVLVGEGKVNVHQQRKLGLVSPIVLASAIGYETIVEILLDHGADANTRITNTQQTGLHYASAEGNNAVIQVLIKKGKADINHADSNGNTALLFAAKAGNVKTMKLLIADGALIDCKNKMGQNIWDFAMQRPGNDFLKAVAELYKHSGQSVREKLAEGKLVFPVGRTPLHVAASNGDIEKIRCLFDLGADPKARDLNGNTYFQVAALNDRSDVLKTFMADVDIETVNTDGNTALHIAAKSGHINSVQLLLAKAKLEARNKLGMTPLHEAVESDSISPGVIRSMVEVVVKASNWSLVDARDNHGNTALHIAARRGRPEIFPELAPLNPTLGNDEGDTPLHLASKNGTPHCLETMLAVFNRPEKGVNIDEKNKKGESILHECVRRGDALRVELLVSCGADLALQNSRGNSALHMLVEEIATQPHRKESLLQVYRAIAQSATKWWCMKKDVQRPSDDSELYYQLLRSAMLHLTSEVYNKDHLNVLAFATKSSAADLLCEVLNTANVYRFKEINEYVFDISNLTPQTMLNSKRTRLHKKNSVHALAEPGAVANTEKSEIEINNLQLKNSSCLEILVSMPDEVLAARILDINPFKILVKDYWNAYQWIYAVLILVHIAYMTLFSVFVLPTNANLKSLFNSTTKPSCRLDPGTGIYGLFLVWPVMILLYELYSIISEIVEKLSACCRKYDTNTDTEVSREQLTLLGLPYLIILTLFSYISHLTALAFGSLAIAWFALFLCATTSQVYVEIVSLVLILGWLFTMSFTKGFEELHMFTIMLKYIVIRDITRFLLIYVFTLVGCGLAFHTLFQISITMSGTYSSAWLTLFNTFNLMMGLGGLWDDSFDQTYASEGGNPAFIKWVYIFYILLANIILLSLLIAMLTDTYTEIKSKEGTTWRVGSLRLALRVERSMPFLKRVLRAAHLIRDRITFDVKAERWVMSLSLKEAGEMSVDGVDADDVMNSVQRLENKIDGLTGVYSELSRQMEAVEQRLSTIGRDGGSVPATPHAAMIAAISRRAGPSPFNVLMQIRERPFSGKGKRASKNV